MQRNAHDLPVYLGFANDLKLDDLYRLRSIFLPLGKIGGKPSWLNPKFLPTSTQLQCPVCQKQMCFLIQVYATSENDPPHSFHRALFIFICRNPHCSKPNDPSNMIVFRCCLPRLNPYYSFDGPMDPDLDGDVPDPRLPEDAPELCKVCGCYASKKCGKCGNAWYCCRDHQALDWTAGHKQSCGSVPDPAASIPLTNPLNKFLFKEYGIEMDQVSCFICFFLWRCTILYFVFRSELLQFLYMSDK
ncbi:MYND finger [Ancylostoma caninum]|uniref:MYND finger n=1 Tax=Ancylostoma caninum TaxID=29170 RepID=A0A368FP75_ANCCA|nr:MYND finger [Ancylostoma caninum]